MGETCAIFTCICDFFRCRSKERITNFKVIGLRIDLYFLKNIYQFRSYITECFQVVSFVREHMWPKAL